MVVHQLRISPAHDQNANPGIANRHNLCLRPHRPALTAPTSPTEPDVLRLGFQKLQLLRLWTAYHHSPQSTTSPR